MYGSRGGAGRKLAIVLASVLGAVLLGGIIWGAVAYDRTQKQIDAAQLVEFRSDLVTNGLATSPTDPNLRVRWKEETDCSGGTCKTEKELDAEFTVAGCRFQAERSEAVADRKPEEKYGNPQMKYYKLDEWVNGSKDGVDLEERGRNRTPFTKANPTRDDIYAYLKEHGTGVFPCFKEEPAATS